MFSLQNRIYLKVRKWQPRGVRSTFSSQFALLLISLFVPSVVLSQSITGDIKGSVRDDQGYPVAGVLVMATNVDTGFGGVGLTNQAGTFHIKQLPQGLYYVRAEKKRYAPDEQNIDVKVGKTTSLEIGLRKQQGLQADDPSTILRPENYVVRKVFYGTDRMQKQAGSKIIGYGPNRGQLEMGLCEVSIPRDHRMGKLESPYLWKFEFRPDPNKHVVLRSIQPLEQTGFFEAMRTDISFSRSKSAFVFVHGFNVTFDDAVRRTAQMAHDLQYDGIPITYSWPSNGKALKYVADSTNAKRSVPNLEAFLRLVVERSNAETIHLIAHSMGNRVLTSVLREFADTSTAYEPLFEQIVLVAPDIDTEIFTRQIAPKIVNAGQRITLYVSSNDKALQLSKELHDYPRAGDAHDKIVVVPGVDTVDVSAVNTGFLGHSYFSDRKSVISDLHYLFKLGVGPRDRFGLQPTSYEGKIFWTFVP